MHEMSLVRSLLRQVDELRVREGAQAVETIRVEMGPLSGVERPLVELAFAELVDSTSCRGARLLVEEVPLSAICLDCRRPCEVREFRFRCTHCRSARLRITGGEEFRLLDVELRVSDPVAAGSHTSLPASCEGRR